MGTALVHYIFANLDDFAYVLKKPTFVYLLSQFNLASENTLSTWFSSMLLFSTAIFSFLSYWIKKDDAALQGKRFLKGWLIIGAMFLLLSLDELGSIHENLGHLSSLDVMGDSSWESVLAIPVILVVVYLMVFGWIHLRKRPATFFFMVLATLLFVTVPVQEHFEMLRWKDFNYAEDYNRPIPLVLMEEGAELFGTLCFIISMILYIKPESSSPGTTVSVSFTKNAIQQTLWIGAIITVFLFILLYNFTSGGLLNADEGIAANWIPAIMPLIVLLVNQFLFQRRHWFIILYSIFLSAYFGMNFYMILNWGEVKWLILFVQAVMISGLVYYIFELSNPIREVALRIQHILGGILIAPCFVFEHRLVTVGLVAGCLLIIYSEIVVVVRRA